MDAGCKVCWSGAEEKGALSLLQSTPRVYKIRIKVERWPGLLN